MSRPPQTPAEAASLHLRLVRQFKMTWFRQYMQYFWDTYYDDNNKIIPIKGMDARTGRVHDIEKETYADTLYASLQNHVNQSETVFVTRDIVHVVEMMSKSMPEDMLQPEDVPFEDMMIFFEQDISYDEHTGDDNWRPVQIRGVHIAKNQPIRSWGGTVARGIMITLFSAMDVLQPERQSDPDLAVVDLTGWKFEQMWSTSDKVVDQARAIWEPDTHQPHQISQNVAGMRKFLLTLLRFMQEEIIQVSRHPLSRAQKRRAEREDLKIPEDGCIITVHLRKVRYVGEVQHTDTVKQWTHRFWVEGHTRHLDYLEPGRTTWVRPYVKGPEWAPLIMKERVTTVNR